jgi:hypothetical protein
VVLSQLEFVDFESLFADGCLCVDTGVCLLFGFWLLWWSRGLLGLLFVYLIDLRQLLRLVQRHCQLVAVTVLLQILLNLFGLLVDSLFLVSYSRQMFVPFSLSHNDLHLLVLELGIELGYPFDLL